MDEGCISLSWADHSNYGLGLQNLDILGQDTKRVVWTLVNNVIDGSKIRCMLGIFKPLNQRE
jgi:hypothetical protein